jgi:hypothetical protein
VYKKWHFVQILSMFLATLGGVAALWVLGDSDNPSERSMALQTLLLIGFGGVANFWLGSSRSSQVKDLVKDK